MNQMYEANIIFDLILIDPPYGNINGLEKDLKGWKDKNYDWDKKLQPEKIFNSSDKLLRENGYLLIFSKDPYTIELQQSQKYGFEYCYKYIWLKNHFANNLSCKKNPVNFFEEILVFRKRYDTHNRNDLRRYFKDILYFIGKPLKDINKILGHRRAEHSFYIESTQFKLCSEETYQELIDIFKINRCDKYLSYDVLKRLNKKYENVFNLNGNKYKGNVLKYPKEIVRYHPTQKPVKLLRDLIETYTRPNDFILDFCMGSGSTGMAAKLSGRSFAGIEADKNFYEMAVKRLYDK
ncbi:MAG: DNA-methyltransferase [Promethearchaeota archaeon]